MALANRKQRPPGAVTQRARWLALDVAKLAWLGVFGAGLLLFVIPLKAVPVNIYDEGLALFNAARVMDGDVPFRDYWGIYPPGQSYALAAVFRLFDMDVLAARVYDSLLRFATALCVFAAATRLSTRRTALALFVATTFLLASATFYGYAVFPALLFSLLAVLALVRYMESTRSRWLLLAGLAVGITAAFRLDVGAYAGISLAVALLLFDTLGKRRAGLDRGPGERWREVLFHELLLTGGAALLIAPLYGYLALAAGPVQVWTDLIVFPTTVFREVRHLPYPPLRLDLAPLLAGGLPDVQDLQPYQAWLFFYLPPVTYALALVTAILALIRPRMPGTDGSTIPCAAAVAVTGLGLGLYVQAMSRYDNIHVLPTSIPTLIAAAWLLHRLPRWFWRQPATVVPAVAMLVILFWPYSVMPADRLLTMLDRFSPSGCYAELPRAGCVTIAADQENAIQYIQAQTREGEPIFVGNRQHDLLFINDISFYFLADRPSATKYHELHPGMANTLPVQQAIVEELIEKEVNWIVTLNWPNPGEPNASAISSNVHHLDGFIQSHYARVNQYGSYIIWQKDRNQP